MKTLIRMPGFARSVAAAFILAVLAVLTMLAYGEYLEFVRALAAIWSA